MVKFSKNDTKILMHPAQARRRTDPFMSALRKLRYMQSEAEVEALVSAALTVAGMRSWFLMIGTKDAEGLFGGTNVIAMSSDATGWMSRYARNNWALVDPFVLHTQHSNTPIFVPYDVEGESNGQKEFLKEFYGALFAYGVVVPIHLAQDRLALLYAGNNQELSRKTIEEAAPIVAAIGQEAAIWLEAQREAEERNRVLPLTEAELELLSLARRGFSTKDIAAMQKITTATVNNIFRRANEKLGTHSRQDAAITAERLGLYRAAMISKRIVSMTKVI